MPEANDVGRKPEEADYNGRKLEYIISKIRGRDDVLIQDKKSATGLANYEEDNPEACYWIQSYHYLVVPKAPVYSVDSLNMLLWSMQEDTNPDYATYFKEDNRGLALGKLYFFSQPIKTPFGEAKYEWAVINLLPSKALADRFLISSPFSEIQRSIEIPKRDILIDKIKSFGRGFFRLNY